MRAVSGAQGALKELSKLLPDTAEVIRNGKIETVSLSELRENDMVLVRPGAKIPAPKRLAAPILQHLLYWVGRKILRQRISHNFLIAARIVKNVSVNEIKNADN